MKQNDFQKVANQVSFVTIVVNILLAFMKLLAGVFAHSNAMISDSIHSASDVFSTMIVVIGIKLSSKQPDKEHPYGHERMECVAAIVLSMVLFMTGLGIGVEALTDVLKGEYSHLQVPGMLALAAAVISIVSKEAMYWYTRYYAKKIDSSALMADASPFRCVFLDRCAGRNRGRENGISGHGSDREPGYFRLYRESGV